MGAVDYLPYAHSRSDADVAIWDGAHRIVGRTTGVNVSCELKRPNGAWYRIVTDADLRPEDRSGDSLAGTYVSAALTILEPGPPGYVWGSCPDNTDQPGRRFLDRAVAVTALSILVAAAVGAGILARGRCVLLRPPLLR